MKNKKLLKEDLNRFNSIMGYNQSKGIIKEEGEQLSMDFPIEYDEVEGRILTNINRVKDILESIPEWLPSFYVHRNEDGDILSDYFLRNTLTGIRKVAKKFKNDLDQGLLQLDKEGYQYKHRQTQKSLGFYNQDIDNFGDFIDLIKDLLVDMKSIGLDRDYYYPFSEMVRDYESRVLVKIK